MIPQQWTPQQKQQAQQEINKLTPPGDPTYPPGHHFHDPYTGQSSARFNPQQIIPNGQGAETKITIRDKQTGQTSLDENHPIPINPDELLGVSGILYDLLFTSRISHQWQYWHDCTCTKTSQPHEVLICDGPGGYVHTYHNLAVTYAHLLHPLLNPNS